MKETALIKVLRRLCQGSKQSVQSGHSLDVFDQYMHIERPIDKAVRNSMDKIREQGGGILFLVGSAGDGKSHMISTLKKDYPDFEFRNDASESPWPNVKSIEALKIFLQDFKDTTIKTTTSKMLVAINMGKLSAFIDDTSVKEYFSEIVDCAKTLFDEDNLRHDNKDRIKIVSFANHQIFELFPDQVNQEYPIDSLFIKTVLQKITSTDKNNIFYDAFLKSEPVGSDFEPCYVNYQLLCIPEIQNSIVMTIIEAIIRFKLMLTPRDLLDFIYRIVVPDCCANFNPSKNFFHSLLPATLYGGGDNKILKCISLLDPLKYGSIEHNDELSELFTSIELPENEDLSKLKSKINNKFFDLLSQFYQNNRNNVEDISKLLFRLKHLLNYHSECEEYRSFLSILCGYYNNDEDKLFPLYELIKQNIPHFYGSYTDKTNIIPLDIQGKEYKLFVNCDNFKPNPKLDVPFNIENRNQFIIEIDTQWMIKDEISLKIEYQLYEYLSKLKRGKLAQTNDRNHNLSLSEFINKLVKQTDFQEKILIITPDNQQLTLSRTFGKKVTLK